jgi:hypothetical protein
MTAYRHGRLQEKKVVTPMPYFPQSLLALVIGLSVLSSRAGADVPMFSLVCTFTGGVTLHGKDAFAKPREPTESRYLFAIPRAWAQQFGLDGDSMTITYTNLDGPWQGQMIAILYGRRLQLLEKTTGDTPFSVHVWLDVRNPDDTVQALYLLAAHQSLPKWYEGAQLRWGSCRFTR